MKKNLKERAEELGITTEDFGINRAEKRRRLKLAVKKEKQKRKHFKVMKGKRKPFKI